MSTQVPTALSLKTQPDWKFAIACARFNSDLTSKLLEGCISELKSAGVLESNIKTIFVPGAFELPVAARALALTGQFQSVICLGAVVKGDTPHFEYVAGQCANGINQVGINTGVPIIFGVLTTNTHQQALDRTGGSHGHNGIYAAQAAIEMAHCLKQISSMKQTP